MNIVLSVYLDLVRALAAFVVYLNHFQSATKGPYWRFTGHVAEAVMAFFVLSGFVIGHVVATRERTAGAYALARLARILSVTVPALLLTLGLDWLGARIGQYPAMYAAVQPQGPGDWGSVLILALFLNEIWHAHVVVGTIQPYWSLGFEVWYYVVFGLFLFVPGRWRWLAVALCALAVGPKIMVLLPLWLAGLGAYRISVQTRLPAWAGATVFAASVAAYAALHGRIAPRDPFLDFALSAEALATYGYYYAMGAIFAANLVAMGAMEPWLRTAAQLAAAPIRWIAGASFTLYLCHHPVLIFVIAVLPVEPSGLFGSTAIGALVLAAVLAVAEVTERRKRAWQKALRNVPGLG